MRGKRKVRGKLKCEGLCNVHFAPNKNASRFLSNLKRKHLVCPGRKFQALSIFLSLLFSNQIIIFLPIFYPNKPILESQALWPGGNFWRLPRETSRFDPQSGVKKKKKLAIVQKKKNKPILEENKYYTISLISTKLSNMGLDENIPYKISFNPFHSQTNCKLF
jgi:hypothetical protein